MAERFVLGSVRSFYLALVILLPRPAAAAWPTDPLINVPISTAANGQATPAIVTDGAGGAIITWGDTRSYSLSSSDIYAQRVLASGLIGPGWTVDGSALCTAANSQFHPTIVGDGAGGAIVAWFEQRSSSNWDIYAQHVLASGVVDPAWPSDGRALCIASNVQDNTAITTDGAGGAIVTWKDFRSGTNGTNLDIYAQHVLADGTVDCALPADGLPVCIATNYQHSPTIVSDGAGGAIVTWADFRNGPNFGNIYAQHVLASGTVDPAWPSDGRALGTDASGVSNQTIVADGAGGAIITWQDHRSGTSWDIYAQRVLASGEVDPAWPAGGRAVCGIGGTQEFPTIVADGAGGAIITWYDSRSGPGWDIYAQRVLASGEVDPAWPADGRALCIAADQQYYPAIVTDGAGGAIVTWQDRRNGTNFDIYAQRVLASGEVDPAWPAGGRALSVATYDQVNPVMVADGSGGAIVTWTDYRNGTNADIYAQRVGANGQLGSDIPTATLASMVGVDARADRVHVVWYAGDHAGASATVYRRVVGSEWSAVSQIVADGSGYLRYEDASVRSGTRYGYRLGLMDDGQEVLAGEAWVDVPALQLALRGATPNPTVGGRLQLEFTLGGQGPARIDMIDIAGRIVRAAEVGSLGPGTHSFELAGDSPLRPGIYFLRLRQSGEEVRARIAVVD